MEPKFLTKLQTVKLPDGKFQVAADLGYQSALLSRAFTVKAGFVTDFASFWIVKYAAQEASVIHDWLYQTHATTREAADKVFHEAMLVTDMSAMLARVMYWAVRLGGGRAYRSGPNRFMTLNPASPQPQPTDYGPQDD